MIQEFIALIFRTFGFENDDRICIFLYKGPESLFEHFFNFLKFLGSTVFRHACEVLSF